MSSDARNYGVMGLDDRLLGCSSEHDDSFSLFLESCISYVHFRLYALVFPTMMNNRTDTHNETFAVYIYGLSRDYDEYLTIQLCTLHAISNSHESTISFFVVVSCTFPFASSRPIQYLTSSAKVS